MTTLSTETVHRIMRQIPLGLDVPPELQFDWHIMENRERRIFRINVEHMDDADVDAYVQRVRDTFRRGIDFVPVPIEQDFYIANYGE